MNCLMNAEIIYLISYNSKYRRIGLQTKRRYPFCIFGSNLYVEVKHLVERIQIKTEQPSSFVNITARVWEVVKRSGVRSGLCCVFVPHTTAGVTINENADPDVVTDMLMELDKMVPMQDGYHHREGNSAAHIKASLMGFSQTVLIEDGQLLLGTWQGIYFCEFDGPRNRSVLIKVKED